MALRRDVIQAAATYNVKEGHKGEIIRPVSRISTLVPSETTTEVAVRKNAGAAKKVYLASKAISVQKMASLLRRVGVASPQAPIAVASCVTALSRRRLL